MAKRKNRASKDSFEISKSIMKTRASTRDIRDKIFSYFIKQFCPRQNGELVTEDGVHNFFNTDYRELYFATVKQEKFVGGVFTNPNGIRMSGLPGLTVKKDQSLLIVEDKTQEDVKVALLSEKGDIHYYLKPYEFRILQEVIEPLGQEWKNRLPQSTSKQRGSTIGKRKLPS